MCCQFEYTRGVFQSLKGFWVFWNSVGDRACAESAAFQSLKGFWVFWNGGRLKVLLDLIFEVRLRGW